MDLTIIDWPTLLKYGEHRCICNSCDTFFRSRAKFVVQGQETAIISRKPCPKCGSHVLSAAHGDPEECTLG